MAHVNATAGGNLNVSFVECDAISVTSGNLICGMVWWQSASQTLSSITDTNGRLGSMTLVLNPTTQDATRSAMFYGLASGTGTCAPRATFSGTVADLVGIVAHEVSTTTTYDATAGAAINPQVQPADTANAVTSTAVTPAVNGSYLFGATANFNGATITNGTNTPPGTVNWSAGTTNGALPLGSEYYIQATAAAIAATFTAGAYGGTDTWHTGIMAFNDGSAPPASLTASLQDPVVGGSVF